MTPRHLRLAVLANPAAYLRYLIAVWTVDFGRWRREGCDRCPARWRPWWAEPAFAPAGTCGSCGASVAAPAWTAEILLAAVLVCTVAAWPAHGLAALAVGAWLVPAAALACIDAAVHRLPYRPSAAAAAVLFTGLAAVAAATGAWPDFARAAAVGAIAAAAGEVLWRGTRGRAVAGGDGMFAASVFAVPAWLGWDWLLVCLLLSALITAVIGLIGIRTLRGRVPHGPGMVTAAAALWVAAAFT